MQRSVATIAAALAITAGACAGENETETALARITTDALVARIQALADDSMEGRGPASAGEERATAYLVSQFRALHLEPGNGESFFQAVPLVSISADPSMRLRVRGDGGVSELRYGTDFIAWTKRVTERVDVRDVPLVFVGYGIVAPEYGWNDYEGVDVKGKAVVILVNDPGFATKDTALFTGNAMTYYGRWTYKYEEAARQGAEAAIIVHETDAAGYPWEVVQGSWSGEQFDLVADDNNMSRVAVEGWITRDQAQALFSRAGRDFARLKESAAQRGFKAVPLALSASLGVRNTIRRSTSNNVLAILRGSERPDELIVYTAHWDHLGTDTTLAGDQIYNGALDNATGVAGLLTLAEAYAAMPEPPDRSVLFLAVTAEEQGLLGSKYYGTHPVYPLAKTVAEINMDGMNILGPMRDVTVIGLGQSELDQYLTDAAAAQGRRVRPDPEPEKGFYYRSDHFSFARVGVPALYPDQGVDHVEHGEAWTLAQRDEYTNRNYHKPSDEYDASWDLSGMAQDLELLFQVGYRLAEETTFPNWSPTSEFRAARDATMRN
jgi:Zn-dependent M28 family amino/carboxypeptidase